MCAAIPSANAEQREVRYVGAVSASFTVRVKSASSPLDAQSTVRLGFRTRLTTFTDRSRGMVRLGVAPFQSPVGTYSVAVSGTDSDGCSFEYRKQLRGPMKLEVAAEARRTTRPMVSKRVSAGYFLDLVVYPLGTTPSFPDTCKGLTAPIESNPADLRTVFSHVPSFNATETLLAGSWPPLWNHRGWPFTPIGYLQLWKAPPPRRNGAYRLPAPVAALAAGKPVRLTRSLTRTRRLPGLPSVTITTIGRVTFTFGR